MPEDLISGDLNFHSIYIHSGITSTVTTSFSGPNPVGFGPQGLTFDGGKPTRRYGNLVSAHESWETIYIHVGVTSTITTSFSMPGAAQDSGPVTITVDASGNLISARAQESAQGSVRIHAGITSTVTTSFSTPFLNCRGITLDASGNLISDDIGTNSVYIHAGITSTITTSFSKGYINGLEISEAGNLISASYYDPEDSIVIHAGITSTITTSFSSPKTLPWGLTLKNPPSQDSIQLLGKVDITHSVELLGRAVIRQDSMELLSNFRVSCPRRMGDNWQRKMWFDDTYYWRGRYDSVADELIFEYIAADGLAVNVWAKNANASIDCSGFAAGWIIADFTVRGSEHGLKTTIHYSDGVDSWVAESNEASLTGWAWQNTTKVFDGTAPDSYKKVNLGADRKTPIQRAWVSAVFVDASEGKQWVKARQQTNVGDITAWDAAVDVSNVDNTTTIYGSSLRSMGSTGAAKDDMIFVYKEGDALRSRYFTGAAWQAVQDIDVTTLSGKAAWDLEHGDVLEENEGHVIYVDADGSVKWRERDAGAAEVWSAAETLHITGVHQSVGIVEHGAGWLWVVWVEGEDVLEYRLHKCVPEVWYPLLANPALQFNVNTDAIVTTSTVRQLNTHDHIPSGEAVPICWIGETAPATPCAAAWGILIEYSIASLKGILDVRQLTSTDLYARLEVGQGSAELLGDAVIGHVGTPVELLGNAVIRQLGYAELLGNAIIRQPGSSELLSRAEVRQSGSAELLGKADITHSVELLGKAVFRHVGTPIELLSKFIVRHEASVELLSKVVIRHTGIPRELVARCVIRHSALMELSAKVEICHWEDLYGKAKIRHTAAPLDFPAIFWVRFPRRLWTSRRYINGVIELDEKLLGDASLEYVIEGVMEDTQGYLDNAGLSYSEWTDITLVPVQILRAVTYGTVAALYARHTQTFRSQVIPSITPVTVTVIGDAEKAMNYWEDRMNQMLEFYVTSQGGDVMLTSTLDEEPVFSMEDIPEEVTEYVSWRIWLQRRNG